MLYQHRQRGVIQKLIQCSFPEEALFANEGVHASPNIGDLVLLLLCGDSKGSSVRLCSHLSCFAHPSATVLVMNIKHRGEDHELGQENVINNLDKYGDGLGRIKERVGEKEVEAINRLDLLLPC